MKITEIGSHSLSILREQLQKAVRGVESNTGLRIRVGNASYTSTFATIKLEVNTVGKNGSVNTREAEDFKKYAHLYDMKAKDLGRTFNHEGSKFTICGVSTKSSVRPILAKDEYGTTYKFRSETVNRFLGRKAS